MTKSQEDYAATVRLLREALRLYEAGTRDAYRFVAVELRKLLCDKHPLILRVHPDFKLHKFHWTEMLEKAPFLAEAEVLVPGSLTIKNGLPTFDLKFARSVTLMPVKDWLGQPFFNRTITLQELIKSVADKEGAHADPTYNDTLIRAKIVKYVNEESHVAVIIGIGRYLLQWLEKDGRC